MNHDIAIPTDAALSKHFLRIVIVGCPAAGKSSLASALAAALQVPVIRRDDLGELGSNAYRTAIRGMIELPAWILDGPPFFEEECVYTAADAILWLDTPKSTVLFWGLKRAFGEARASGSLMHAIHRTGGPLYAMYAFASRRAHFADALAIPKYKAKVRHIQPRRFVSRLPNIDCLIDLLRDTGKGHQF